MVEAVDFATLVRQARQLTEGVPEQHGTATTRGRVILGITGSPGAGKSSLAHALHHELAECSALITMDGFHLSNKVLKAAGSDSRKGAPDTFDVAGFVNLLARLHRQTEDIVYAPEFDRTVDESIGAAVPVHRLTPLVIVEGNYLLHSADQWQHVAPFLTESWFVAPPEQQRQHQLIARHQQFGRTSAEATEWALTTDQANADLVELTKRRANRIIHVATIPGTPLELSTTP